MKFFTLTDFEEFAELRKLKIKKESSESRNVGNLLKGSIYAKTNYWAERLIDLLAGDGFEMEMSWRWSYSQHIRSYTWARLYLHKDYNTRIFFTVGMGSRFTVSNERVNALEYKLDCLRNNKKRGLSPAQVDDFDNYLANEAPRAVRQMIDAAQLSQYDWEKLIDETYSFIKEHLPYYKKVKTIVWPNGVGVNQIISRLCWNGNKWQKPSGVEGKDKEYSSVNEKGFGYEEWLFCTEKQLDGYHYAYIHAFNSGDHMNKTYDVALYAVFHAPSGENYFYWIGNIKELFVLNETERINVFEKYRELGWLKEMSDELDGARLIRLDENSLNARSMFNVRFKAADNKYTFLQQPLLIVNPTLEIGKKHTYDVLPRLNNRHIFSQISGNYEFREGHNLTQTGSILVSLRKRRLIRVLKHKKIQENIYNQLKKAFSGNGSKVATENPTGFGTSIDLVVKCPKNGDTFYEIKTNGSALRCIREGLGQLFEYSFFPNLKNANRLIVVAPYPIEATIEQYIRHLRDCCGVPLYYQYYSYKDEKLMGDPV